MGGIEAHLPARRLSRGDVRLNLQLISGLAMWAYWEGHRQRFVAQDLPHQFEITRLLKDACRGVVPQRERPDPP